MWWRDTVQPKSEIDETSITVSGILPRLLIQSKDSQVPICSPEIDYYPLGDIIFTHLKPKHYKGLI